jgi:hypothetical protein
MPLHFYIVSILQETTMRIQKKHAAALILAGLSAIAIATPSFARPHAVAHVNAAHQSIAIQSGDDSNIVDGHFAPGSTGYGRWAYNPEQPTDPDPRIGGSLKMRTDR